MPLIEMYNNVPDIYNTSRDFQILENLYNCILNGVKFDSDTIIDITNTGEIRENLLTLLQYKLGFFTNKKFTNEEIRQVLVAFPYLVKNKGSKKAIREAVYLFANIKNINQENVRISFTQKTSVDMDSYVVSITFVDLYYIDTTLLEELFKYILPCGWFWQFQYTVSIDPICNYNLGSLINKVDFMGTKANSGTSNNAQISKVFANSEYNASSTTQVEKNLRMSADIAFIQSNDNKEYTTTYEEET